MRLRSSATGPRPHRNPKDIFLVVPRGRARPTAGSDRGSLRSRDLTLSVIRYCGRDFTAEEIDLIGALLTIPQINRARLSREVCERLNWRRDNGKLKDMSCRVALARMQADGLITLPPPRNPKPVAYRSYPHIEQAVLEPSNIPIIDLATLTLDLVLSKADSLKKHLLTC